MHSLNIIKECIAVKLKNLVIILHLEKRYSTEKLQTSHFPPLISFFPQSHTYPCTRAGLPYTREWSGTSFVTTLPAPIIAYAPTVMPATIVEFAPMEAWCRTTVSANFSGLTLDLGKRSFVKVTFGPTKTLSSSLTPSHTWTPDFTVTLSPRTTSFSMKTRAFMLQFFPILAPGRTTTNCQIVVPSPI